MPYLWKVQTIYPKTYFYPTQKKQIMSKFLTNFKDKYQITNNWALVVIFIAFGITGSSSVFVSSAVINTIGELIPLNGFFLFVLKIMITTPIYMVLLFIIGSLLGQHRFFSQFLKHMRQNIARLFRLKKSQ